MRPKVLKSLDLFTGCGGLTHALRNGIAHPVMYCEREESCIATLNMLMANGKLPKAPIHTDVQTLKGRSLRGKVDIIMGGWPCVGFSAAGHHEGFENQQSGLFAHVVRLISEIQPSCVFMENVGLVTQGVGIDHVCAMLGKRGYALWWMTVPAYVSSGACPHQRKRWFCLAVKRDIIGHLSVPVKPIQPFVWTKEPVPRMILRGSPENTKRLAMLGNSVVPDAARAAFLMLWTGTTDPRIAYRGGTMPLAAPSLGPMTPGRRQCGACGFKANDQIMYAIPRPLVPSKPTSALVLDPSALPLPDKLDSNITTEIVKQPIPIAAWATPRHGMTAPARVLTQRSKCDLPTQLRFEKKTPKRMRLGHPSASWVDWLMGYEPGWTSMS